MSTESNSASGGIGILGVLGVVFVVLKLFEVTAVAKWSWWLVTMPFWIGIAIASVIFSIAGIIALIVAWKDR